MAALRLLTPPASPRRHGRARPAAGTALPSRQEDGDNRLSRVPPRPLSPGEAGPPRRLPPAAISAARIALCRPRRRAAAPARGEGPRHIPRRCGRPEPPRAGEGRRGCPHRRGGELPAKGPARPRCSHTPGPGPPLTHPQRHEYLLPCEAPSPEAASVSAKRKSCT